jgi:acetyl-CoA acetyltransferase
MYLRTTALRTKGGEVVRYRGGGHGVAAICIGVGQGLAVVFAA